MPLTPALEEPEALAPSPTHSRTSSVPRAGILTETSPGRDQTPQSHQLFPQRFPLGCLLHLGLSHPQWGRRLCSTTHYRECPEAHGGEPTCSRTGEPGEIPGPVSSGVSEMMRAKPTPGSRRVPEWEGAGPQSHRESGPARSPQHGQSPSA